MNIRAACLCLAIAAVLPLGTGAAGGTPRGPVVERILDAATARAAKLGPLEDCIAVTPNGVAVVGDGRRLWAVGASGAYASTVRGLSAFVFTPDGLLVGVRGNDLVYLGSDGRLQRFFSLPDTGMNIVPGDGDSLLLFGQDGKGRYGLYVMHRGRRVVRLLDSPKPITGAAALTRGRVLFVAGGILYEVQGRALHMVGGEPGGHLISVAVDVRGKRIFTSDGKRVFLLDKSGGRALLGNLGGTLRWYGGGLLILDSNHRLLVRLVGVPQGTSVMGEQSERHK